MIPLPPSALHQNAPISPDFPYAAVPGMAGIYRAPSPPSKAEADRSQPAIYLRLQPGSADRHASSASAILVPWRWCSGQASSTSQPELPHSRPLVQAARALPQHENRWRKITAVMNDLRAAAADADTTETQQFTLRYRSRGGPARNSPGFAATQNPRQVGAGLQIRRSNCNESAPGRQRRRRRRT